MKIKETEKDFDNYVSWVLDDGVHYKERDRRFKVVQSKSASKEVQEYVRANVANITINIGGDYIGGVEELSRRKLLEGWCWQTTETIALFFQNANVVRGYLHLNERDKYYHAWLYFKYKNSEYVYDPCLNFLSRRRIFDKVFTPEIETIIPAEEIKETFIYDMEDPEKKKTWEFANSFFKELFKSYEEYGNSVRYSNDVTHPMFRNNSRYKAEIEDGVVKSLKVHYYYNG